MGTCQPDVAEQKVVSGGIHAFRDPYDSRTSQSVHRLSSRLTTGPIKASGSMLYVPKDAAPGKYQAPIRVSQDSEAKLTATLELNVHNSRFPTRRTWTATAKYTDERMASTESHTSRTPTSGGRWPNATTRWHISIDL